MSQTIADINAKIKAGKAKVLTATELKSLVLDIGVTQAAKQVDVIVTGTFEPMESSGAILNLGHTDPPIKIRTCWIDGVPAYAGFGAVDIYLGATQEADPTDESPQYRGGGHAIADLIAGKTLTFKAIGHPNDCYPRANFETTITKESINQFYLFNPRNLYQNFIVGVNGGEETLYTYLGPLQPRLGNAVYSNPGAISPLWNDPDLQLIGIGTRIFMGGGIGYVAWEGTQHFPLQKRLENRTPIGPAATLALIGDAKQMTAEWVRGCYFRNYGASLMMGVAVPLPVINEEVVARAAVLDEELVAPVIDFSIPRRVRPIFGSVSYAQLKSGKITIAGSTVRTAPLASLHLSEEAAKTLKDWILKAEFTLTEPVAMLPSDRAFLPQDVRSF
ncbi:homocysteine biosynthesis protein [Pseudanabaena sp. 'Roaring Creek']|uniref:homocysteine biosynthesis protein n=1 Tax=Pseudanabaena sp. 'Roaring Creek' TaxID=1681830 RepID=UPI0006D76DDC|nr:homocysteine biosynthesis protein [Pseudanabaena sp. 'Roaring Creek']